MKTKVFNSFYKSFFQNTFDGIAYCQMVFDKKKHPTDFIFKEVNENYEKLTGMKKVVGKKVSQLLPKIKESNPEMFATYARVASTRRPERLEIYVKPLARWFLISIYSPKKDYFVAIFQNITKQKKMERNLEDSNAASQNVLEDLSIEKGKVETAKVKEEAILLSIGDGLVATDEEGTIILINKAAQDLLGKEKKEVIGKVFSEVILMEDDKGIPITEKSHPVNLALASVATNNIPAARFTYYYLRKDKTKFPVAIVITPVILDGKVIGTIEIFRDITQEKEIDKAKSEFVSLASHQLKTPPTAIKLLTERLLGGKLGVLNTKQEEYLNDVHVSNQRMIDLVNTLLNVSRIEFGGLSIQVKEKDPCEVVQSIFKELDFLIDKKQMKIRTIYPKTNILLMLDEPLFRMIVNNLIINAIHYTKEGGEVEVECRAMKKGENLGTKILPEDYFMIIVSDTGLGIPQNDQNKIFTKFFRADNAREKLADGTGLGLYIVKSILDYSGGLVWFTSRENEGSIFYMAIPMAGMTVRAGKRSLVS